MPAILKFGLILLLCALVSLACGFLAGKYAAIAAAGFAKNLRHDLFQQVQSFSFTNIDRFSTVRSLPGSPPTSPTCRTPT